MKNQFYSFLLSLLFVSFGFTQDSTSVYKKRVLETSEVDFLSSYYTQKGNNASVTGGVGDEKLTDLTPTIVYSIPLNADDVLTIDAGISTYTSASSSNLNPFDRSGSNDVSGLIGSPWVESSGASGQDTWGSLNLDYSHSSDDRNKIWSVNGSFATEYDYSSIGLGGSYTLLFNEKNTEFSVKGNVYLDTWSPQYPTELSNYLGSNQDLNQSFFEGVDILDQNGLAIDKTGNNGPIWSPSLNNGLVDDENRNTYSLSFSFSQILNKNAQFSLFFDVVQQQGWLANPMQRVYFGDVANYYVGDAGANNENILNYTSPQNTTLFQLADDIERLPDSRFKLPIGLRFNYYMNEIFSLRTYYRYYFDDWGIQSHTASIEVPIKIAQKFTLYPSYRYYTQTAADYFGAFEENLSTSEFYTSDFDLSEYNANQIGFGINYTDIFTKAHIWKFGLKSIDLRYNSYKRNIGLNANIIAIGFKFVMD